MRQPFEPSGRTARCLRLDPGGLAGTVSVSPVETEDASRYGRRLSYPVFALVVVVPGDHPGRGRLARTCSTRRLHSRPPATWRQDVDPARCRLRLHLRRDRRAGLVGAGVRDDHRTQRWVWAVPIFLVVCIVAAIDYGDLADRRIGFTLALVGASLLVGWGEEGMFRGIGVTSLREQGLTEGRVALWSCAPLRRRAPDQRPGDRRKAIRQAIAVSFAGYFFYLIRRAHARTSSTRSCTAGSTS